ncbi:MAG: undecaprenyl-phosphate glucose phosphotransferase [Parcubacteria group bacterium CG11_big_fil_rev_8_21_14_0_20_48_46]|nr:MAG: hypothetical protein AUK21_02705 [Parcubacteria group bacterium CG2_30_48_51]PIW78893.1 MAG: undecaprenyl-phosphate glucose phosphotransferase [Parcubacteria group bacterium CG_4_8_14_3_um_filter_48_16]PIY77937.1 MAG: undecaprenyl-phosphate glucose phosphotransferase [Parcubacteria group bacterium CG_4_10_14_0_8_um_filter_48_154]PIZ78621.1 MAG: undecaprenyl-phosphate glucose phosphotransferase [bacterium CG_4_10_14_0_2_um_filter_48_144]PJC39603.1 MAG: undecaprenyl-phosphate glucose phos
MKKSELIVASVLVPLDYLMLLAAAATAYSLRFGVWATGVRPVIFTLPFATFLKIAAAIAPVWILFFAFAGLYAISGRKKIMDEISSIVLASSTSVLIIIIAFFFEQRLFSSRFIILAAWGLGMVYVVAARMVVKYVQRSLYVLGKGVHKIVVIGDTVGATDFTNLIRKNPRLGYILLATYPSFSPEVERAILVLNKIEGVDELIQADTDLPKADRLRLFDFAYEYHFVFKYIADFFRIESSRIALENLAGLQLMEVKRTPLDGWGRIVKRLFDIVVALLLMVLFSPLMLVIALVIKLDSPGAVLFTYQRIGEKGKPFTFRKFRSMVEGAHTLKYSHELQQQNERAGSPVFKLKHDPRVTRVGAFLRTTSLDELPQLFSVVRGVMSLVGPRPHEAEEVARYAKHHKYVLAVRPGMTGLAQINGRSDLGFEEEVRLDTYYIENWSLKLDVYILAKTPLVVFSRKSAC